MRRMWWGSDTSALGWGRAHQGLGLGGLTALLIFGCAAPLLAQEQEEPDDQRIRYTFSQKFGANDNIRLNPDSVGTTYYSDTGLGFDFRSQTALEQFQLSASAVLRAVNDEIIGTDAQFRDPILDLSYTRNTPNARFALQANYALRDLAFLDPLQQEDIGSQDFFSGGGQRETIYAGITLETGLQAPFGFFFDLNTRSVAYNDQTDPLLVPNRTDSLSLGGRFQFAPTMRGRLDWFESRFDQEENVGNTILTARTADTSRITAGLDLDLSPISTLILDFGYTDIDETFTAQPNQPVNVSGLVGSAVLNRELPNGLLRFRLDSELTTRGRQDTLEAARQMELPGGRLGYSLGITRGATFDAEPIGSLDYAVELPRGQFNASVSRSVSIDDTLNQLTNTTRANLGYLVDVNALSSLRFDLNYADISLAGQSVAANNSREQGSFSTSYTREVTEDWDLTLGYSYRYYNPENDSSASSNELYFSLERNFDTFR